MEVKAKWTGCGFVLCLGEWKLYVDGKDVKQIRFQKTYAQNL